MTQDSTTTEWLEWLKQTVTGTDNNLAEPSGRENPIIPDEAHNIMIDGIPVAGRKGDTMYLHKPPEDSIESLTVEPIGMVPVDELEAVAEHWEREDWQTQEANLQARSDASDLRQLIEQYE